MRVTNSLSLPYIYMGRQSPFRSRFVSKIEKKTHFEDLGYTTLCILLRQVFQYTGVTRRGLKRRQFV